jgi:predicted permease
MRFALRQLRKSPGFAITAILSLALGIGATTAVFSVVYGVLMNPYPYKDAERMVHLVLKDKAGNKHWPGLNGSQIRVVREARSIESVVGENEWNLTTSDEDLPEDVAGDYLTPNATTHFGVPALIGRGLIPSDAPFGQDPQPVVVLSHKFWLRHYSGNPDVLGKTLRLVHKSYTIVGVMPPRFTWGDGDVYLPLKLTEDPGMQYGAYLRLKPGVTRAAANAELQSLIQQFAKDTPNHFPPTFHVALQGLNDQFVERLGPTLFLLFGAVGLLLAIGCANVSILLLARGTARRHELAVRAAMGAGRGRILRQLLTESLQLSIAGAALGVLLAYQGVNLIVKWLPENSFPHEAAISINVPVLIFSVVLALGTGILFGLSPALHLSRPDLAGIMRASTRRMTAGVRGKRIHGMLVAGQVALTLLLLASAGGAIRGFVRLMHTNLGYDPHHTMSVGIPVHDNTFMTWEARSQYFAQLRERIAALPEVTDAGISTNATPPSNGWNTHFEILGKPVAEERELRTNFVSPEYFTVLHIPLLQGRVFDKAETLHGARLALVNQTLAHEYWPLGEAIGQQIRVPKLKSDSAYDLAAAGSDQWLQIVGVVADARDDGLREAIKPAIYVPYTIMMPMYTQILVRTRGEPLAALLAVRAQVRSVNPDQQVMGRVRNLEQWISTQQEWAQERLVATLFGAFAMLALVLSVFGLYSVVSYIVAQRTNEFGIRMALGAARSHVLQLVFASTSVSVGGGLAAGVVLSLALKGVLSRWAQGSAMDIVIVVAVAALLTGAAIVACVVPAYRASAIDPATALRYE